MKVKDLIKMLEHCNQNKQVVVYAKDDETFLFNCFVEDVVEEIDELHLVEIVI